MLFLLAGSALVQYVKYLIALASQIEPGGHLDEQTPNTKPVAPPDSKLGSSACGCLESISWSRWGQREPAAAAMLRIKQVLVHAAQEGPAQLSTAVQSAPSCSQHSLLLFSHVAMLTYPLGCSCAWRIMECALGDSVRWDVIGNKIIFS